MESISTWLVPPQLVFHYSQIWFGYSRWLFLLPEPHNLLKSAIACPVPQTMQLLCFIQFFQLEQPFCSSNPLQMDKYNLLSFHLDADTLLTPTMGRRIRQESHSSLPLSPASSTPHHNAHAPTCFIFSLYPYHCPPSPALPPTHVPTFVHWLCDGFSINPKKVSSYFEIVSSPQGNAAQKMRKNSSLFLNFPL